MFGVPQEVLAHVQGGTREKRRAGERKAPENTTIVEIFTVQSYVVYVLWNLNMRQRSIQRRYGLRSSYTASCVCPKPKRKGR